ncbi:MAG TPA: substrate-binding domain-containing protein [Planctomycetota bacterium]|nr:substrate-binding domain-containing protein [Planctomycetota bacterium]
MPDSRHVALALDMDKQDLRWHGIALGVARFAQRTPHWRVTLDPFPLEAAAGTYQGVITDRAGVARACVAAGIQVVCASWDAWTAPIPRVVADHRRAGHLAAEHLLGRGYRHLAFVGYARDSHSRIQEGGFRAAAHKKGVGVHIAVLPEAYFRKHDRWAYPRASLRKWFEDVPKPVGVFAVRDLFALHVAELCREKGLRVPDDVGLLGTGNESALCALADPPLSSVDLNYQQVGERAGAYLERLMGGGARFARNPRVTPSVVVRASSDRWAEADAVVTRALRHIAEHSHEAALRVGDVAAAAGVSQVALGRRFRAVREATVVQEVARVRAMRARDLLATTGLSVADVARRCGFRTAHRLALVFRKQEGLSPREWRRRAEASPEERRAAFRDVKWMLVHTTRSMAEIARRCGYGSAVHLAGVFREREYLTPEMYRRIYRPREPLPPPQGPRAVETWFIGPDGATEEVRRTEIAPAAAPAGPRRTEDEAELPPVGRVEVVFRGPAAGAAPGTTA